MFLLRRAAARAISASPSKAIFAQPRTITTFSPCALRVRQQQWSIASFQRRYASDEASMTEAEKAAAEVPDNFAQTAAEAPVEDGLTPAQQDAHAEPTNAAETVGADGLEQLTKAAEGRNSNQRTSNKNNTPNNTLYIGNLYYEVTTEQLQRVFARFGEIESVKIVYDNRGLSRGFGYVEFKNVSDAQTAVDNLDMQVFEGRNLVVQFHAPKPNSKRGPGGRFEENAPTKTLFIGNMSFEMSDKDLNDLFRDIRNVMDVRVAIDRRTGQPRGFAHADFIDVTSAQKARELLKEKTIYGRQLRVDFSTSTSPTSSDRRPSYKRQDSTQED